MDGCPSRRSLDADGTARGSYEKQTARKFFSRAAVRTSVEFIVGLAAALLWPVFSRHLAAAPGRVRRLQAVRLSMGLAAGHVQPPLLAAHAVDQQARRLAVSSQDAVAPVRGAVPRHEAHALLRSLAEECRISGARLPSPGRAEHCRRRHQALESRRACALAAGHVLPLAVKDGNWVASAALLLFLRLVWHHPADSGQMAMATDVRAVPQASHRACLCLAQTVKAKRLRPAPALQLLPGAAVQLV